MRGAGSTCYPDMLKANAPYGGPLGIVDVDFMLGLYIANGLHPVPNLELVDSKNRNSRVTSSNLETVFLGREKGAGHGMTRTTKAKGTRCQLCNLHARTQAANMISQRSNNPKMPTANCAQVRCETCKVELCIECWNAWHKIGEA